MASCWQGDRYTIRKLQMRRAAYPCLITGTNDTRQTIFHFVTTIQISWFLFAHCPKWAACVFGEVLFRFPILFSLMRPIEINFMKVREISHDTRVTWSIVLVDSNFRSKKFISYLRVLNQIERKISNSDWYQKIHSDYICGWFVANIKLPKHISHWHCDQENVRIHWREPFCTIGIKFL